jgi:hypothetical protein
VVRLLAALLALAACKSSAPSLQRCASDADCPATLPTCDGAAHVCTGCLPDSPSCSPGFTCDAATRRCVARDAGAGCSGDYDCRGATPYCDQAHATCVACLSDSDCELPSPRCDPAAHVCAFGCRFDSECGDGGACNLITELCSGRDGG